MAQGTDTNNISPANAIARGTNPSFVPEIIKFQYFIVLNRKDLRLTKFQGKE